MTCGVVYVQEEGEETTGPPEGVMGKLSSWLPWKEGKKGLLGQGLAKQIGNVTECALLGFLLDLGTSLPPPLPSPLSFLSPSSPPPLPSPSSPLPLLPLSPPLLPISVYTSLPDAACLQGLTMNQSEKLIQRRSSLKCLLSTRPARV